VFITGAGFQSHDFFDELSRIEIVEDVETKVNT
jgi:hypothetical protein